MTLNQLEYFQKVATLQHFRQAAELLKISQPSLSRSMSLLEEELGLMLFEHHGRNVVLTKSGRGFLEHVNRILEEVHIAEHKMKQLAGSGGHIDIAYVFPLANYYIPHTVRSFLDIDRNKHVTFNFNQTHTADMIQGLKSDRHDVIFGSFVADEPDISFVPILNQNMVVITPKEHPLVQKESVCCSDLTDYPLIGYDRYSGLGGFTRNFYKEKKLNVNIVCECPDENAIAALVAEDFGIALVARVDAVDQANVTACRCRPYPHRLYGIHPRQIPDSRCQTFHPVCQKRWEGLLKCLPIAFFYIFNKFFYNRRQIFFLQLRQIYITFIWWILNIQYIYIQIFKYRNLRHYRNSKIFCHKTCHRCIFQIPGDKEVFPSDQQILFRQAHGLLEQQQPIFP